jgi:hypothetical protein
MVQFTLSIKDRDGPLNGYLRFFSSLMKKWEKKLSI